ncbi:MAG: hypothetical protein HGN29_13465 [Asgard group archaeon]|nr:hypothetical protein [Asgard group archaeon]
MRRKLLIVLISLIFFSSLNSASAATCTDNGEYGSLYTLEVEVEEILNLVRLLDPPIYLKEKVPLSVTPTAIRELYVKILNQLQAIDEKISE